MDLGTNDPQEEHCALLGSQCCKARVREHSSSTAGPLRKNSGDSVPAKMWANDVETSKRVETGWYC